MTAQDGDQADDSIASAAMSTSALTVRIDLDTR
jgi:hypothetical protein